MPRLWRAGASAQLLASSAFMIAVDSEPTTAPRPAAWPGADAPPQPRRGGAGSPGRASARRLRPTRPPTRSLRPWPKALAAGQPGGDEQLGVLLGIPAGQADLFAAAVAGLAVDQAPGGLGLPEELFNLLDGRRVGGVPGVGGVALVVGAVHGPGHRPRLLQRH